MEKTQDGGFWDVVVIGTGLIECIIASGLSMRGYSVLVLDSNTSYGGLNNTLKFHTAHNWISDSPEHSSFLFETSSFFEKMYDLQLYSSLTETESDNLKKIYIDMMPKVLFSRGHLVEMILSSNISSYLEFQGIEDVYFADMKDKETLAITRTPFSKKEIFSSTDLNLVEKRQIMRLYSGIRDILEISKIEENVDLDFVSDPFRTPALIVNTQNNSKNNNYNHNPRDNSKNKYTSEMNSFSDFQDFWKINDRVLDLVKYNIVFFNSNHNEQFEWRKNFTRYFNFLLSSLNQHGCIGTPFLYPNYGTCDLPQSFSRLAAVKGSVQRLGTHILSIEKQLEKEKLWRIHINSNNLEEVTQCKLILGSLSHLSRFLKNPVNNLIENKVLCYFMILDRPLITPKNSQNHKKLCFTSIKIGENKSDNNIAYILQCDYYTGCCPSGYYIVYINKVMGKQETTSEARNQIQDAIDSFLSEKNNETKILYKASYVYKQRVENPQLLEDGLMLVSDPSINNNSFFLLDEDIDKAILALDKSLKFLSSQNQETVTFQNFSNSEKDLKGKPNPTNQELNNQYIIKKLQNILD